MNISFLGLIIEVLILGFVAWLIEIAPFFDPLFKSVAKWILIAVAVILVIVFLVGVSHGTSVLLTN